MKTVGIIVEYNPFHNGHLHHINETRRLSNCDYLICVMSGNFTQRGEPAITDKFTRTRMALNNGIDLVVELPFVFTVQNADIFAQTSVDILHHLNVDEIYFGSENADVQQLERIGNIMQGSDYNRLVKAHMNEGNSYPTSSDKAMKEIYPNDAFELPNNILGIQYILSGKKLNTKIKFHTIKRISTNYFDEIKTESNIQSASSIRKLIKNSVPYNNYVPDNVTELITEANFVSYNDFYNEFKYIINSKTKSEIKGIFNINEGFENRFLKMKNFTDVDDLISQLLTRRYTNSKVKRMMAHILCNTKQSLISDFNIPYIRILGMNDNGKAYLNKIKHDLEIPLISNVKEKIHPYLDHEIQVSRVYSSALKRDLIKDEIGRLIY